MPRRLLLAAGTLAGAAAVGLAWLFLGNDGNSSVQGSLASLGQAPGIPPPAYAYLDNASVALYLGQLQGGIAKSEQLTQQLTQGRNAGLSAGGLSLGGSTGSSAAAARTVTPTATARFYQLLDLLGKDGYLHTVNMAASPSQLRRAFAAVPEGSFVQLRNCTLRLPSYVQLEQVALVPGSPFGSPLNEYSYAGLDPNGSRTIDDALELARDAAAEPGAPARPKGTRTVPARPGLGGPIPLRRKPALERRLGRAIHSLGAVVGANPRVPVSTCNGQVNYRPHGVDLLFPIRLGTLSNERTLLAGPVTLVGKLVRAVRSPKDAYVDDASLTTFSGPLQRLDRTAYPPDSIAVPLHNMSDELTADAAVLAPGAVILPIAIYK